jgi:hypothetical protein
LLASSSVSSSAVWLAGRPVAWCRATATRPTTPKTFTTLYTYRDDAAEVWGLQLETLSDEDAWTRYTLTALTEKQRADYHRKFLAEQEASADKKSAWTRYAFTYFLKDKPFVSEGQSKYNMLKGFALACSSVRQEMRLP